MKPTLKSAVIAAGLAVAALPSLRAADESSPPPPPTAPPSATAGEQTPEARPRRGQRDPLEQAERLKQALNLTQEQSAQIIAIIKGNAPQRQAIISDDSLSRDDKRAKMEELRNATQAKIRVLLTPEQQKKFDAMPHPGWNRRDRGPGHENPPPPPPPSDTQPPANPPSGGT